MVLALLTDLVSSDKTPGRSTLTQQLSRNLFPVEVGFAVGDRSPVRKVKESLVSIQMEKRYTKEEIFTLYCNQIYWGHGAYGVEAASQVYFGKPVSQLNLEEAALIAGIIQGNARQSPYVNMDAAMRRRNYALQRMADEGYITQAQAEEAKLKPIVTRGEPGQGSTVAPYYIEEVRKYVETKYGAKALYENGLTIRTTLDADLQRVANRAVDRGLRQVAKRRGVWRRPARNVLAEGHKLEDFTHDRWARPIAVGDIVPAVVMSVDARQTGAGAARVRFGTYTAELVRAGYQWTRRTHAAELVRPGDVIQVGVASLDESGKATVTLEQEPQLEGALVAIDNRTGQVLAMVGGYSFSAQQVQPRDAGLSSARFHLQAVPLHRGHRPRPDADVDAQRFARGVRRRCRPTAVHTGQLRWQVSGSRDAAPGARELAQHSRGPSDGNAWPRPGGGVRQAVRLSGRLPTLPVHCARCGRGDAARGHECLQRVSRTRASGFSRIRW